MPIGAARANLSRVPSFIPDSVVSRTGDNSSFTSPTEFGVRVRTSQEWPSIGAEISSQTSGATEARIYRVSDGTLVGSSSISSLVAGDTFTVENVDLQANTEYNFVLWAEGDDWTSGFYNNPTFPYTSPDGNLEIINGADSAQSTNANPQALVRVGDVGF